MTMKDLLPWRSQRALRRAANEAPQDPFVSLRNEMNRLFDDFWGESSLAPWGEGEGLALKVDLSETDREVVVQVDLPGLEEKDVQVTLDRNALVVSGEKKSEHETKDRQYHRVERSYGSFRRVVPLPAEVDETKSDAVYKNGVLTVRLNKAAPHEQARKKIPVKTG